MAEGMTRLLHDRYYAYAADLAWVNSQCTMQPIATFQQPLLLKGKVESTIPTLFILASGWNDSPFPKFFERARAKGWKTMSIACGHDVMLDRPAELTQALLEYA